MLLANFIPGAVVIDSFVVVVVGGVKNVSIIFESVVIGASTDATNGCGLQGDSFFISDVIVGLTGM